MRRSRLIEIVNHMCIVCVVGDRQFYYPPQWREPLAGLTVDELNQLPFGFTKVQHQTDVCLRQIMYEFCF